MLSAITERLSPSTLIVTLGLVASCLFGQYALMAMTLGTPARRAQHAMMQACAQEYPDQIKGKTIEQVATWAESQKSEAALAANPSYRDSGCNHAHERWKALAGSRRTVAELTGRDHRS